MAHLFLSVFFLALTFSAVAQTAPAGLGKVSFPVSCKPEVRPIFERGVALLHSFQYGAAEKSFLEVSQGDPHCAMAYWGMAMSIYHPLWEGADEKAISRGQEYIDKAKKIGGMDAREREYVDALGVFYNLRGDKRLIEY